MPLVERVFSAIRARVSRRFATKASRFSLAVSCGFVIAFVGFVSTGLNRDGFAEGLADLFGSGFAGGQSFFGAPQPQPQYAVQGGEAAYMPRRRHAAHRINREVDAADRQRVSGRRSNGDELSSGRSMCVRLCDGYAFPVGDYHGDGDRAAHEATCHAECPGAQTALYIMPAGSDSIADSVRVGTGRNYSQLPDAFHYTNVLDSACTCHPAGGNRIKSLLHDFTLRRGDAVMTQTGFKVFHGGGQFPYKRKDFVALNNSRDIRKTDRATFKAIERASLQAPIHVAQKAAPRNGTKALEHQAALKPAETSATP